MKDPEFIQAMIDRISERLIDGIPNDYARLLAAHKELRVDLAIIRVGLQSLKDHPELEEKS